MTNRYMVTCFARKAGAIGQHGTLQFKVQVEAETPEDARVAAIDKAYSTYSEIEHVSPRRVTTL